MSVDVHPLIQEAIPMSPDNPSSRRQTGAARALPAPMVPCGLVLPGIAEAKDVAFDIDYLDRASPQDAAAFLAAIELYAAAYRERPSGSLPSDEAAQLALLRVRGHEADRASLSEVLSTRWTLCSDGRLYRPQLAVGVLTTWLELALMPFGLDVMAKSELREDAVASLRRLKPRAEILGRIAAATGRPSPSDDADDYDPVSAVAAGDLARLTTGARR